ncbi:hypothetical protein L195_g035342, partial [Trifolium pratense]
MLFEIALTVNPLAFEGFGEVYEPTCASAFAGGLSSSITVWAWAVVVKTRIRTDTLMKGGRYHAVDPSRKFRRCHRQS